MAQWATVGTGRTNGTCAKKIPMPAEICTRNGIIEDKNLISYGMPSLYTAKQAADAVMRLSTTTNGKVAVRAWRDLEKVARFGKENRLE